MKTSLHRAPTDDLLLLQGALFEPDTPTNKLILHIHGMAGNYYENRFLDTMAKTYTDNDWALLSVNTRGHDFISDFPLVGEKETYKRIGNHKEIFAESLLDIKAWMECALELGYHDVVLQGHSLGTVKIVYYLTQTNDPRVQKLVLASPPDMVGLAEAGNNHPELLVLAKQMIQDGRGDELLPTIIWNWYHMTANTYADFFQRGNPIDIFNTYEEEKPSVLAEVKIPVLAFLGSEDDAAILPVPEALRVIKKKAKNAPLFETHIIQGAPHSYFGHEQEISDLIIHWLTD